MATQLQQTSNALRTPLIVPSQRARDAASPPPPAYTSLQPDQAKQLQQLQTAAAQQVQVAAQQPPAQQGVPFQAWPQGQAYQPAPVIAASQQGPIQYIAAPPVGDPGYQFPTFAVASPPPYEAPHDFLILALVTTIICAILNLISLAFGIPAIILSAMSINAKRNKDYPQAKSYGKYSLMMTILNIFFTLCLALLITGLVVGYQCYNNRLSTYYYSYYYYSYYGC